MEDLLKLYQARIDALTSRIEELEALLQVVYQDTDY